MKGAAAGDSDRGRLTASHERRRSAARRLRLRARRADRGRARCSRRCRTSASSTSATPRASRTARVRPRPSSATRAAARACSPSAGQGAGRRLQHRERGRARHAARRARPAGARRGRAGRARGGRAVESLAPGPGGPGQDRRARHRGHDRVGRLPARGGADLDALRGASARRRRCWCRWSRRAGSRAWCRSSRCSRYVEPLVAAGAGVIVLGCTHYPLLKHTIAAGRRTISAERPGAGGRQRRSHRDASRRADGGRADRRAATGAVRGGARLELLVTDLPRELSMPLAARFLGADTPAVTKST